MNRVVIVDTGIDLLNEKLVSNKRCVDGYFISKTIDNTIKVTGISENKYCIQDEIGHGTGIAEIIASHNKDVELIIVKIFSEKSCAADEELLYFTLNYILKNITFDILNLSLGIVYRKETGVLEKICASYYAQNKIIVSAFDNAGAISFPAALKNVIGVTSGDYCYKSDEYYLTDNECVNVCAKGRTQRVYWKDGKQIVAHGNSYACAHFTGILSNFCPDEKSSDYRVYIREHSCASIKVGNLLHHKVPRHPVNQYKKAVVFPFNKEIHSLIRFSNKLSFKLVDVYDIKYSAKVGAHTNELLQEQCENDFVIKDITQLDINSFDTFILGHTDQLFGASNLSKTKVELITKLIKNNKNIYSFDDLSEYLGGSTCDKKHRVFSPSVTLNDRYIAPFGKLYRQDKPVLGIFGTSSSQGKMTLQLKIRYELLRKGYKLCQIGTEPSALLYGMDGVFPIGYNSTVSIKQYDTVAYLNKMLYDLSRDSDLIMIGGQSGMVLRDEGNLSNYLFQQIDFMYATLPDNVILCVNPFDSFDIIDRAIRFVESAICCKVIALSLYPFYYEENDAFKQHIKIMSKESFAEKFEPMFKSVFGLPIFYPNDKKQIESLCDLIIESFTCDMP